MTPLTLSEVALLVALVNTGGRSGKWWAQKARAIIALATFVDGEWWNGPDVERLTGIPAAHARRLLLELERQKVLVRDGGHHARSKVFWCEVNPDWRAWDVEWSMSTRDIELRLGWIQEQWTRAPLERLFSRPAGARSHRVIARLSARDFERQKATWGPVIARGARAISDPGSRAEGARSRGRRSQEVSLLRKPGQESSSLLDQKALAERAEQEKGEQHLRWGEVRSAYCRKVGTRYLYGKPAGALARLLARHDAPRLLEAIDQAGDELGVALLVDELSAILDTGEPLATVTPIDTTAAVSHLQRMIATYREAGAEPPESLLEELARCQNGQEAEEA